MYQELWRKPKPPRLRLSVLQPGCVLLRNAIDYFAQQELVDLCVKMGEGEAGWFTPTFTVQPHAPLGNLSASTADGLPTADSEPRAEAACATEGGPEADTVVGDDESAARDMQASDHGHASDLGHASDHGHAGLPPRAMKLRMLCLGHHWDHESHCYMASRDNVDGLPVPPLPALLSMHAASAVAEARAAETRAAEARAAGAEEARREEVRASEGGTGAMRAETVRVAETTKKVAQVARQAADILVKVGADRLNRPEGRGEGLVPVGAGADRSGEPAGHDGNVDNGADSSADAADAPPEMTEAYSPDVAIVNMYGKAGHLGLHQD